MSLSKPTAKNPATRFMQWRGGVDGGGRVTYYDKENQEDVEVKLPFRFTVLDELSTITGFSEKDHSGFWSNEVWDIMNDELVVKTKSGTVARGLYSNISEQIKGKGAKYAKSVYIAFKDDSGEMVIGNLKLSGASLTSWIEFQKKYNVQEVAVAITNTPKKEKKGANYYYVPVFQALELSKATLNEAVELDKVLQSYLSVYMNRRDDGDNAEVVTDEPIIEDTDIVVDEDGPKKAAPKKKDEDELDLAEIPF